MKRLPSLFFILIVLYTVLWAQHRADSTVFIKIDTLIKRGDLNPIPALIQTDATRQAAYWDFFCDQINLRAEAYYDQDTFTPILQLINPALELLAKNQRSDSLLTADLWLWKALAHLNLEQYTETLNAYNKALRLFEYHRYNNPIVAYAYKNAAQILMRRKNYTQAGQYLRTALQSDSTGDQLLSVYGQLANNAYWQDSLGLALFYFETGKDVPGDPDLRASIQSIGSLIFLKKGDYTKAESLSRSALAYYLTDPGEFENRMRCYTGLAEIAAQTQRFSQAEAYYRSAEKEGAVFKDKSREMAKLYTEWGDFLAKQGQKQRALALYQKAMIQAFPNFDQSNPLRNPSPDQVPLELWAMIAPARKAALLLQTPSPDHRRAAAQCFDLSFAVAARLRRTYGTDEAKLYLAQHNYNLRRESALNLLELFRQSGDTQLLEQLFLLLENNRANTLREALQQQRALALSSVPDSLLSLEEQQRLDLAELQTNIQTVKSKGDSTNLLEQELTRTQLLYDELFEHLKEKYPNFRNYLEAGQTASFSQIKAALPDSTLLLSWFDAGDRYLCLALRQQAIQVYEVLRDSTLDQTLLRFQTLLADKTGQETNPSGFFADAYFLKQALLPDSILRGSKGLVMVPDGRLAYLPFEVLLTQPHSGAFATAPYLLRDHRVQYVWSATLLTGKTPTPKTGERLLQLAPFVKQTRKGLALLPNSLRELPNGAVTLRRSGPDASASQFLEEADAFEILHLSTHAHAGQRAQPGIEFYDRTVLLPEIYAQRLHASLVALSACETGTGDFAEGEGVLSLARAFAYAGAQSLVASHWSVSDRSTADLFAAFYQQLEKGLDKSEALRQAKLQVLAQAGPDARKAPFYWAAFTFSGTDGPVNLTKTESWPWWAWALLGILAVLLILGIQKNVSTWTYLI